MNNRILDIADLLIEQKKRLLTAQEQWILDQWVMEHPENASLLRQVQDEKWMESQLGTFAQYDAKKSRQNLEARLAATTPVHRIHLLRTAWFRYAAAIILLLGIGTYLYVNNQKEEPSVTQHNPNPVQSDVAPGGNKATLTLADGSKIILDSAANGTIAKEENAMITKRGDQIIYDSRLTRDASRIAYNTMSTPRGGQYQLRLPDGSQVWLNAESSITYPTAFTGNQRKVRITGEAYFEVTHDKKKPFIVAVSPAGGGDYPPLEGVARRAGGGREAGGFEIEVLGTHFNVNTYQDEPAKNTTLLEGSVRINAVHTSLTLKPGQQGQLTDRGLSLAVNPDIDQVMAWKNGLFNFNNRTFAEVMSTLARWYDVEVKYEGKIPNMRIGGEMGRDLNLSDVLQALKTIGVKYEIEGRTLKVIS